jgi:hypothetical protein
MKLSTKAKVCKPLGRALCISGRAITLFPREPERDVASHTRVKLDGAAEELPICYTVAYRATAKLAGRIASSRCVPERAGRCLIRMLPALQCFVKRRAVGMRDCGGW